MKKEEGFFVLSSTGLKEKASSGDDGGAVHGGVAYFLSTGVLRRDSPLRKHFESGGGGTRRYFQRGMSAIVRLSQVDNLHLKK